MHARNYPAAATPRVRGFTLVELLVVIAIIIILIGILIPVVRHVQQAAKEANTKAWVAQIAGAFDNYYSVFHAYPGPLSNNQIHTQGSNFTAQTPNIPKYVNGSPSGTNVQNAQKITAAENAFLGLQGGLMHDAASPSLLRFDTELAGQGPRSLNAAQPKKNDAFITNASVSAGHYEDESGEADDTDIPEFVDKFNNPMPILIMRSNPGRVSTASPPQQDDNSVITDGSGARQGHYDISQIIGYTAAFSGTYPNLTINQSGRVANPGARTIGVGKTLPEVCQDGTGTMVSWKNQIGYHGLNYLEDPLNTTLKAEDVAQGMRYFYPYDAFAYFTNYNMPVRKAAAPNVLNTPRQKDRYIIISAGKDRIYGTEDDITNFGDVAAH
jgi:prepilin-type N-terminal cleavage/methylation domain-containing protein